MPIYEYVCGSCKEKTEVIQGMKAPRLKVCPSCGGKLTKAFSAPAIQFKGSGFYITDYARGSSEGSGSTSRAADEKAEKAQGAPAEKSEKSEKTDKTDKPVKTESAGKSEKVEKKAEKKAKKSGV